VEYAEKRTKEHILFFTRLYDEIKKGAVTEHFLEALEKKNNIFREIDYRIYASRPEDTRQK
jgi:1,4-alpha-glucan branching enzyme